MRSKTDLDAAKVSEWLRDKSLLHPLSEVPSFVDLVRHLAMLGGARVYEETGGIGALRELVEPSDCILMVVVDGLGVTLRDKYPPGGFFDTHFRSELRAVFPSTTACALTTLVTAAWPGEHGITGWWTHFPEVGRTISTLRFIERFSGKPAQRLGLRLRTLVPVSSIYPEFMRATATFVPKSVNRGEFPSWSRGSAQAQPYRDFEHLARRLRSYVAKLKEPGYLYLYTLNVDGSLHKQGSDGERVQQAISENDAMLSELRRTLPPSVRIVVTADHGLIDIPRTNITVLGDELPIAAHLDVPPSAEGTTPVFHVKPGHEEQFKSAFAEIGLSDRFALITPDEAEELRLYGPQRLSEPMRRHLGTYIGIARDPYVIEYVRGRSRPLLHLASHGGMRPAEMRTPLFVA